MLFAGIIYHDGQGVMAMRRPGITSALELTGATVCVQEGTTSRATSPTFSATYSMTYTERVLPTSPRC